MNKITGGMWLALGVMLVGVAFEQWWGHAASLTFIGSWMMLTGIVKMFVDTFIGKWD